MNDNFTAILQFLEWCQNHEVLLDEFDVHYDAEQIHQLYKASQFPG